MKMTFDEYIQNPMGRENAVISNRIMYRNLYTEKLDKILVREAGKIDIKAYQVGKRYICYLKIPSEVVPKFYYDVLIEFTPPKGLFTEADLKKYTVRFYSNDPSFVFTFAHAFIKNDMFIKDFEDKMSKKAIKDKAKEKNPYDQVGYVKSLYFAYLIMSRRGYFSKTRYVDTYSEKALKREITDADKKIQDREDAAKSLSAQRKKDREKLKKISSPSNTLSPDIPVSQTSNNRIKKVGTISSSRKGIKSSNRVGKIKKK